MKQEFSFRTAKDGLPFGVDNTGGRSLADDEVG